MAETALAWTPPASTWNHHSVRDLERASIRQFMERNRRYLTGRVLDFGAGEPGTCREPQPYRDLVRGEYVAFDESDRGHGLPEGSFHAIICTQVLQYLDDPAWYIRQFWTKLKPGGHLVMTYPTSWDEVEEFDFWRFTKAGMQLLLRRAGFQIAEHERRASINLGGFQFPLGYGVVAQRPATEALLEGFGDRMAGGPFIRPTGVISSDTPLRYARLKIEAGTYTRLTEDESAALLTGKLHRQEPFLFLRYGDGALECINGGLLGQGHTCDGEQYAPDLGRALQDAWDRCIQGPNVYVGDWLSADFSHDRSTEYRAQYAKLIGNAKPNWLNFGCLLVGRESGALLDFYRAVKADPRRKVYLGPAEHAPAAKMLGCEHVITPMRDLFACVDSIYEKLARDPFGFDILLWAAGMAGTIPVVKLWEKFPGRTYINLGSAMDPLTRGYTRSGQLTKARALEFFRELL
jgi:SAM-dependent methyltransferase